jgi:peptidase A4-like protein
VHELYYDGGRWQHNDLTVSGKAPNANSNTALAGYATEFNQQQHVIFTGPNNHIFELLYNGSWTHNDLTLLAGASNFPAASGSPLDGYTTNFNQQQHVNYVGADNHVHELYYDGAWKHNDLTQLIGAPAVASGSGIDGYSTEFNRQQHVNYIGIDNHIYELYYDGAWKHNDLTQLAKAPNPRINAGIDGYATNYNQQQHVNFVGLDDEVHELYYDGSWKHNNLTIAAGPSTTFTKMGSGLVGYATEYNKQQHVIYIGADAHVEELFYDSQWKFNDLSKGTVSGAISDAWIFSMGMWNVPQVSQPDLPSGAGGGWTSSSWVGIDGDGSNDVLQAGIEQKFDGRAAYTAWYEWYAPRQDGSPDYVDQTNIGNFPVTAGDSIWCIVRYIDNQTKGSVFLANETTGHFFSIELDPPPGAGFLGNCIEWIMETPSINGELTALPAFTEVVFTSATGLNVSNVSGNPINGSVETIFKSDTALTSTALGDDTVTIDYLPWHALNIGVEGSGPKAGRASALDGYVTSFNQQLHVNYIGADNHVHELYYDGGWKHNDLTQLGGAPNAIIGRALDGYSTEFNRQQHVNFIGADNHVYELYYDNGWKHNDLTQLSGAPVGPIANSPLDGYVTAFNQQQHVNFIGTDNHVHEIYYDGAWKHNDLTQLGGAPNAISGSALDGYSTEFNRQQHVNFIGGDNHVYELYYDNGWKHNDLTQLGGAPVAAITNSPLDGYATAFNQQQHVNFIGADNRVYELVYDNGWRHTDLLSAAGASNLLAISGSRLDGYSTEFNNQQHVNFIGMDGHIHELWYSSSWQHNDLTQKSGSSTPVAGSPLAGYASPFNQQQHVIFLDASQNVIELMF